MTRVQSRRSRTALLVALLATGTLLLTTTQPWLVRVQVDAAGLRWPHDLPGAAAAPLAAPAALVVLAAVGAASAVSGRVARMVLRWLALAATVGAALAVLWALIEGGARQGAGDAVVSTRITAWAWIGVGAAWLAVPALALWAATRAGPSATPEVAAASVDGTDSVEEHERHRRQVAQLWKDLDTPGDSREGT